ncbi:MAG: tetratricopeptide repeat protein [Fervidobacterium sp.]
MSDIIKKIEEAIEYTKNGEFSKAVEIYETLLSYDIPEVYNNLGNIFRREGMIGKSIQMYRKAIELDSNFSLAYFNLGCALMEIERYSEAIMLFEKAKRLGLESFDLDVQLALCYLAIGNNTKAKELLKNEEVYNEVKKFIEREV